VAPGVNSTTKVIADTLSFAAHLPRRRAGENDEGAPTVATGRPLSRSDGHLLAAERFGRAGLGSTAAVHVAPATATGLSRSVVVPSPSWPMPFSPQQYALLVVVSPHVWELPALTRSKVSPPATALGVKRR
jgi:hypothetical protein